MRPLTVKKLYIWKRWKF